jgi:hypothetical protein
MEEFILYFKMGLHHVLDFRLISFKKAENSVVIRVPCATKSQSLSTALLVSG